MLGSRGISSSLEGDTRALARRRRCHWDMLRPVQAFLGIGQPQTAYEALLVQPSWGWLPALSLSTALALALIAFSMSAGDGVGLPKTALFGAGAALVFFPLATRIVWSPVSRFEQIGLLLLAAGALYTIKFLSSPLGFTGFDEFLHWATADDILVRQRLFTPNALLPISPLYPGLEIVTTAVANVTGLPLFASALILLAISRVIFMCALFLFFEAATKSLRIAAIACVVYMGNASFPIFHISFSYESLAVVFLILAFLAALLAKVETADRGGRGLILAAPFLLALAITHHLTAFIAAALLAFLMLIVFLSRPAPKRGVVALAVTLTAVLSAWGWLLLMGNPITEYLAPNLMSGLADVIHLLKTWTPARKPFVSTDGVTSPLWQRATMLFALGLICVGLAMGFFRIVSLAGVKVVWTHRPIPISVRWTNDWLVMLVLITLAFPITLAFRLTESAWEIGNRLGPYLYFGIAPVVAAAVAGSWLGRSANPWRGFAVGAALTITLVGGVLTAWGGPIELPRRYKVVADALSIEPMGIEAATWTKKWLGPDHRFVSDRINRLLLATYGRQQVVTMLQDEVDTSGLLFAERLGPEELNALKVTDVDYLLVDMRMTQALPRLGIYFERGEDPRIHEAPPEADTLLKFNQAAQVSRPFDNGYIIIYEVAPLVRKLRDEQ